MSNRDRILAAALRLFNDRGSHAVSTNHVAEEASVSVGNLYYHFKSKEEIILELFDQLDNAWKTRLSVPDPVHVMWRDVCSLIAAHFDIVWEFRFFYREQIALRQNDAVLTRRWNAANRRGREDLAALLSAHFVSLGHARPGTKDTDRLADATWLIADFWLVHQEMRTGPVRRRDLDQGVELFVSIIQPLIAAIQTHAPTQGMNRAMS